MAKIKIPSKHIYHKGESAFTTILKGIGWDITLPIRFFKWFIIIMLVLLVGYSAWSAFIVHEAAQSDSGYSESVKLLNNIIEAAKDSEEATKRKSKEAKAKEIAKGYKYHGIDEDAPNKRTV